MGDERYPSDGAQWTHLRQHEPKEPLNMRHIAKGALYDREKIADPNTTQEPVKIGRDILKPVGNQANWQHWIAANHRSDRDMPRDNRFGAWTMAMPSVVTKASYVEALATMIRPDDELLRKTLVTDEPTIQKHAALLKQGRGFAPAVREQIYPLWPEGDSLVKRLPSGMPGVTLTATYPDEQVDVFMPSPLGALISDHRSVTPDLFSSIVYDIQGDSLSLRHLARLSNALRVGLPAPGFGREPGLALLATKSPSSFGYATYWFNGSFRPSKPKRRIITGANKDDKEPEVPTRDEVADAPLGGLGNYAPFSWEKGGPMHPGAGKVDKHFHGLDADGSPWSGGHTDTASLYYMDIMRDAPLDFEAPFHPVTREGLFPYQVHLQYDERMTHSWQGETKRGLWRWHVRIPIQMPWLPAYPKYPTDKPPETPPYDIPPFVPPPGPEPKPPIEDDPRPKAPRLHKPVTRDPAPAVPESSGAPKGPVTGERRTERTRDTSAPTSDGKTIGEAGAAAKAASNAAEKAAEQAQKAAIDAVSQAREAMRGVQAERANAERAQTGSAEASVHSVTLPACWRPVAKDQLVDNYGDMMAAQRAVVAKDRVTPSQARLRIETNGGSKAAPATIPYETAMPSMLGMAVPMLAATPSWNRFGANEAVGAFYAAPLTGHLQAFGRETASLGWNYTHKPGFHGGEGPYQRGTAVGGLLFAPPEINLDDADPWRTATTGTRRVSPQTLLLHPAADLAFGKWSPTLGVISGFVLSYGSATQLDLDCYDSTGAIVSGTLDAPKTVAQVAAVHLSSLGADPVGTAGTLWFDGTDLWLDATQLTGSGTVPDPLLLTDGSVTDPTYSFVDDTDSGVWRNPAGFDGGITVVINADGIAALEVGTAGVYIPGKLTVDGLIDPTGLELNPVAANPGGTAANTLWLDSSDSNRLKHGAQLVGIINGSPTSGNVMEWVGGSKRLGDSGLATADIYSAGGTKVTAADGGTGTDLSAAAQGSLVIMGSAGVFGVVADVAAGSVLLSGGVGTAPSYGKVALTTHVSGTLPIANGGTGGATADAAQQALIDGATSRTPVLTDTIGFYDIGVGGGKTTPQALLNLIGSLTAETTLDPANDKLALYDNSGAATDSMTAQKFMDGMQNLAQATSVTRNFKLLVLDASNVAKYANLDDLDPTGQILINRTISYSGSGSSGKTVTLTGINRLYAIFLKRNDSSNYGTQDFMLGATGSFNLRHVNDTGSYGCSLDAPAAGTAQVLTINSTNADVNSSGVTYELLAIGSPT